MSKPIQFGLTINTQYPDKVQSPAYLDALNRSLELVRGHFDTFWMIDHLDQDDLESFTTLAYLAALHPQFKFGQTVVCQSYRSPSLVAKMGATLQYLSGGRYLFGIGAGGYEPEYRAFGYDFPPAGVRVAQLEEALHIITALWAGGQVSFQGKYYRVHQAVCEPKPDPVPPILVGAYGPKMLRLAARYADEWNVASIGAGRYRGLLAEFERACAEVGREPAAVKRSWGGGCICSRDPVEIKRIAGERYSTDPEDDFDFLGSPEQIVEQMRPFIDIGVRSFMVDCGGFPALTTLELMISEVLPVVNGWAK